MFTLIEQTTDFRRLNQEAKQLLSSLLSQLPIKGEEVEYPTDFQLYALENEKKQIFVVKEGFLRVERDGYTMFMAEAGDLTGWGMRKIDSFKIFADCPVKLNRYDEDEFFACLSTSANLLKTWNQLAEIHYTLLTALVSKPKSASDNPKPERRYFESGHPIIIQETSPTEVYIMLSGKADVYVNDIKVGEILDGEIFGAMAATTDSRRSASVIARTYCMVSALPKSNFLSLIRTHPHTVLKLIEDMSRIIVSQNEKIVEMTH